MEDKEENISSTEHINFYLHNVSIILEESISRNSVLFTCEELSLYKSFIGLRNNSAILLSRMFNRRRVWFLDSQVEYYVDDYNDCKEELLKSMLLVNGSEEEVLSISESLSLNELKEINTRINPLSKLSNKSQILQSLKSFLKQKLLFFETPSHRLLSIILSVVKSVVSISPVFKTLYNRCSMLFFMTPYFTSGDLPAQNSKLLLEELNKVKYPPHQVNVTIPIYKERDDMINFENACKEYNKMSDESEEEIDYEMIKQFLLNSKNKQVKINPLYSLFSAEYTYVSILCHYIDDLEKEKKYEEAVKEIEFLLDLDYISYKRPKLIERYCTNLEHIKRQKDSLLFCYKVLNQKEYRIDDITRYEIVKRIKKLHKYSSEIDNSDNTTKEIPEIYDPKNIPVTYLKAEPTNRNAGQKSRYYNENDECVSVEELGIEYYNKLGYTGFHSEGSIYRYCFILLFWDIIYEDIPNVFHNKFQYFPIDLNCDELFYENRKELIDKRLKHISEMKSEELKNELYNSYMKCKDYTVPSMNFEKYPIEEIIKIGIGFGGEKLSKILFKLCKNHNIYSTGLPDLILYKYNGSKCEYCLNDKEDNISYDILKCKCEFISKMVEVKGERDHLSTIQILWSEYLLENKIDYEILKVGGSNLIVEEEVESDNHFLDLNIKAKRKSKSVKRVRKKRKTKEIKKEIVIDIEDDDVDFEDVIDLT